MFIQQTQSIFFIIGCAVILSLPLTVVQASESKTEQPPSARQIDQDVKEKNTLDLLTLANKYSLKNLSISLQYADGAMRKARRFGKVGEIFDVQRDIGFIYEDNNDYANALAAYQEAEKTARRFSDSASLVIGADLAIISRKLGNYRQSYDYYDKNLELSQKTGDQESEEESYHGLGFLLKEVGEYDKAIELYFKSLELAKKKGKVLSVIISHTEIADAYLRARALEPAQSHIDEAYQLMEAELKKRPDDDRFLGEAPSVLNKYGEILNAQGNFDGALKKSQAALELFKQLGYKSRIAGSYLNIAEFYIKQKEYQQAENAFQQCALLEKSFVNRDRARYFYALGDLRDKLKDPPNAENAFLKSLAASRQHDFKDIAQKCNYRLFLIALNKNENASALGYIEASNALNDSLFNEQKTRRIAEMELKFDTEKRENEALAFKHRENRFLLVSSLGLFMLILGFLSYIIQLRGRNYRSLQLKKEEVQQQYRRLEETNEILSQFAYVAAHDLKEPLRSIGSYIGLIQMKYAKDLPPDAKEYMGFVNAGVKRMYRLLTDLLDFSKVLAQEPGCEVIRPEEALEDVKQNLRSAIETTQATIVYPDNLPSIRMNRLHLLQIFQNLIGNAIKFSHQIPRVTISGREENGEVVLTVQDNGIGIPKEYSSKIFVIFQQLNKKNQYEGTGIGLTICKNIVEKYNGKIWFESEENKGATFYFSIPK